MRSNSMAAVPAAASILAIPQAFGQGHHEVLERLDSRLTNRGARPCLIF